jgi:hypothetical protein
MSERQGEKRIWRIWSDVQPGSVDRRVRVTAFRGLAREAAAEIAAPKIYEGPQHAPGRQARPARVRMEAGRIAEGVASMSAEVTDRPVARAWRAMRRCLILRQGASPLRPPAPFPSALRMGEPGDSSRVRKPRPNRAPLTNRLAPQTPTQTIKRERGPKNSGLGEPDGPPVGRHSAAPAYVGSNTKNAHEWLDREGPSHGSHGEHNSATRPHLEAALSAVSGLRALRSLCCANLGTVPLPQPLHPCLLRLSCSPCLCVSVVRNCLRPTPASRACAPAC